MTDPIIMAIDPGKSGGFAWKGREAAGSAKMPDTEGDVVEFLRGFPPGIAVVEEQAGFGFNQPGKGNISSAHMFTFGKGYGFLLGALQALGWVVELVRPQKWQKGLSLGSKRGCDNWKGKLKEEAQRRYPHAHITLATADALLILAWRLERSSANLLPEPVQKDLALTEGQE